MHDHAHHGHAHHHHDHPHGLTQAQDRLALQVETGRATNRLIATMLGGVLVIASFVVEWMFSDTSTGYASNQGVFYRDSLALIGGLLLAIPLWWHAVHCLWSGHMHMDELVAVAILAAFAITEYQTAAVVAFFLLLSNLI